MHRAVHTEVDARRLLQALPPGEVTTLGAGEAAGARDAVEGQVDWQRRPWMQQAANGSQWQP